MNEPYYSFNRYLQEKFGQRVQRISLDAGFNCPNLDGSLSSQGCIYCNNKGFTRFSSQEIKLEEQIVKAMEFYQKRMRVKRFIAYFQSFSNTYADLETLKERYDLIRKFPQIVGLFISTRPDCIDAEKVQLIAGYQKDYLVWIEYGLQTTQDRLLNLIKRNHSYADFLAAYALARKYKVNVGVHLILGLPGSTYADLIQDAERIGQLDIQGLKFHILHLLRGTQLTRMYEKNKFTFLEPQNYVKLICDFLEKIPSSVVILRLISDAHSDYLIAPLWINDKHKIIGQIQKEFQARGTYQGYRYESGCS